MNKILELLKKYKEVIMYLIFGVLTTVINIVGFYIFTRFCSMNLYVSNVIAWIVAVTFAFITNKLYVFESKDRNMGTLLKEGISFFGFRLLSLGFDMGFMVVAVEWLHINDMIAKVVSNVVVIVLNYAFSKVFIFKKKEN